MSVSRDDPRPPYLQVADDLRSLIDRGDFKPGQRLPSGRELAKRYEVALQTAQRAVDVLKTDGILVAHPPQGVFVRAADDRHAVEHSPEYSEIMSHLEKLESAIEQVGERVTQLERTIEGDATTPRRPRRGASRSTD